MEGLGWLSAIIVGGLAGWIASNIMKSDTGIFMNIILGIVGAVVANFLLGLFGINFAAGSWLAPFMKLKPYIEPRRSPAQR